MDTKQEKLKQLRQRAENVVEQLNHQPETSAESFEELVHELSVYHVELEIQLEDLQQAYRVVENAQQRYANLFDFAPLGYIVMTPEGVTQSANLTAASMLGIERSALERASLAQFVTHGFQDIYHLHRRTVVQTQQAHQCEVQLQRLDGSIFHAQLTTDLSDYQSQMLLTAITNISTIKQVDEALRRALDYEKEINRLRTHLLSVISHEFRTPLTVILSSMEALERYGGQMSDESKQQRYQSIRNYVWYLNDTIQDASTLQAESAPMQFKPEAFELHSFLRQMIADMLLMAKAGQAITLDIHPATDESMVMWDKNLVRRILMNLLSNAIKYSEKPIHCLAVCETASIELRIEDGGIGISVDDQKHIFDAFYRGRNASFIPGTGIGLYVALSAAKAHGGTIRCESQLGKGTTFILEMPRQATITSYTKA